MSLDKPPRYDTVRLRRLQELVVKRLGNDTRGQSTSLHRKRRRSRNTENRVRVQYPEPVMGLSRSCEIDLSRPYGGACLSSGTFGRLCGETSPASADGTAFLAPVRRNDPSTQRTLTELLQAGRTVGAE